MNDPAAPPITRLPPNSSERFLINDLCRLLEGYLDAEQIKEVYRAYLFGANAHEGQSRLTGEPYIYHPLAVAKTMAEMRLDAESIMAAILHDVVEDTSVSLEQIADEFGDTVAKLVDGVSKLSHLKFESRAEAQAASFRKMMMAMTDDLRVILVKLADRLHNMRTVSVMRPEKRRRIAHETLEVYAPIAQRLGINLMRRELERLGFEAMYPMRYKALYNAVERNKSQRRNALQRLETVIVEKLETMQVNARIFGREKNLYSIYRKMREKRLSFDEVQDVLAMRIVVEDIDTCYRVVGAIHTLFKPLPGRFKDYIAIPKSNGYQSLHTIIIGPTRTQVEIQIRTRDMDLLAEKGIAAHWQYKNDSKGVSAPQQRANEWLKSLLELQDQTGNALEFFENVKIDLFPDEVYVFTPGGDIKTLTRGATGIDFAYAVHTDVGNHCTAIKIDKQLTSPGTVLQNGQCVEVITDRRTHPSPSWLNAATTARARSSIRHYLKQMEKGEAIELGKHLLAKAYNAETDKHAEPGEQQLKKLVEAYGYKGNEELYSEIGMGNRLAAFVVRDIKGTGDPDRTQEMMSPLMIKGTEGVMLLLANCCRPIPGDAVVGILSKGRGMVIHRQDCPNVIGILNKSNRTVSVVWAENIEREFVAAVRMQTIDQRGVLASIAAEISALNSNIEKIEFDKSDTIATQMNFLLGVTDLAHLNRIMRKLGKLPEVMGVYRPFN